MNWTLSGSDIFNNNAGKVGIGTGAAPGYKVEIALASTEALRFGVPGQNSGGFLTSVLPSNFALSGGAVNSGGWSARTTSASIVSALNGTVVIYTNDGLTAGSGFTPTARFAVSAAGAVTINGLGGSGSGLVGVDNSGNLSFRAGTSGLPAGGAKSRILVKQSTTDGDAGWYDDGFYAEVYGVKGDNSTDNLTALNALLTAAGDGATIKLPPGIILVSGQVTPRAGQTICGMGMYATTLKYTAAAATLPLMYVNAKDNVCVREMTIDNNGRGANNVLVNASLFFKLDRVYAKGSTTPIGVQAGSHYFEITNCRIQGTAGGQGHGIFNALSHYGKVIGNYLTAIDFGYINWSDADGCTISGNTIEGSNNGSGFAGIRITPGSRNAIVGNVVRRTSVGITLNGGFANAVTGNTTENTDAQGIVLQYNTFSGTTKHCNWNTVTGNTVYNPYVTGTGPAIQLVDSNFKDGCQGNAIGPHTLYDDRGPVHTTAVFANTMIAGAPTFPNHFDTTVTNSHVPIGP